MNSIDENNELRVSNLIELVQLFALVFVGSTIGTIRA